MYYRANFFSEIFLKNFWYLWEWLVIGPSLPHRIWEWGTPPAINIIHLINLSNEHSKQFLEDQKGS